VKIVVPTFGSLVWRLGAVIVRGVVGERRV